MTFRRPTVTPGRLAADSLFMGAPIRMGDGWVPVGLLAGVEFEEAV